MVFNVYMKVDLRMFTDYVNRTPYQRINAIIALKSVTAIKNLFVCMPVRPSKQTQRQNLYLGRLSSLSSQNMKLNFLTKWVIGL